MAISRTHEPWLEESHTEAFDRWSKFTSRELRKNFENFNEIQMFMENSQHIKGSEFVEIGCATGELHRYMKDYHSRFDYYGFDVSESVIKRASQKYPHGNFFVCSPDLANLNEHITSPAVLIARDVVHHQATPFEFLTQLVSIPAEAAMFRLRTKDVGDTILDPEFSCQRVYQKWVPFIVMNIDELVESIKKVRNFSALYVRKHYEQLGGFNGRFLPKDCYLSETGTAVTTVFIRFSEEFVPNPVVVIEGKQESRASYNVLERGLRRVRNRIIPR